ncbi:MAG: hypothetical protein JRH20_30210, partial [Deltaproteobacteria bacterium]|nr:hypothetical protein [Deltaproteobacteria bacterium]
MRREDLEYRSVAVFRGVVVAAALSMLALSCGSSSPGTSDGTNHDGTLYDGTVGDGTAHDGTSADAAYDGPLRIGSQEVSPPGPEVRSFGLAVAIAGD